jgi:hypothetical protein
VDKAPVYCDAFEVRLILSLGWVSFWVFLVNYSIRTEPSIRPTRDRSVEIDVDQALVYCEPF